MTQGSRPHRAGRPLWRVAILLALIILLWEHQAPAHRLIGLPIPDPRDQNVKVVTGRTEKVCQVVGEFDRHQGRPVINATESRAGFWGTDLGASFEHKGRLYVLFGDTHPVRGVIRPRDADTVAVSKGLDDDGCLKLSFRTEPDGAFRPLSIPGVDLAAFNVPSGGLSLNGRMYVFASSDHPPGHPVGRGVLASSDDDGLTFRYHHDVSIRHFATINPALVEHGEVPHLPPHAGDGVLLWGSGAYRRSNPHLAFVPADRIEDPAAKRFFAGLDPVNQTPNWSADEADSVPMFDQPCVGEFSVAWNPYLRKWLMIYNCGWPRSQILLRSADLPWGPWSKPEMLFAPERDAGRCAFLNPEPLPESYRQGVTRVSIDGCRIPADLHNPRDLGDSYAPYVLANLTEGVAGRSSTIYFLMSTWNPYTVVMMRAELHLRDDGSRPEFRLSRLEQRS